MKVTKVSGNTITTDDGVDHTLAPNAKVTVNGQQGSVGQIKKDDEVTFSGPADAPTGVSVTR